MPDSLANRPPAANIGAEAERFVAEQRERFAELERAAILDLRAAHRERMRALINISLA